MFLDAKRYLYIDTKVAENDKRMRKIFLSIFGTDKYSGYARKVYYGRETDPYKYCYKDVTGVVYGYSNKEPIEKVVGSGAVVLPLSAVSPSGISIGSL